MAENEKTRPPKGEGNKDEPKTPATGKNTGKKASDAGKGKTTARTSGARAGGAGKTGPTKTKKAAPPKKSATRKAASGKPASAPGGTNSGKIEKDGGRKGEKKPITTDQAIEAASAAIPQMMPTHLRRPFHQEDEKPRILVTGAGGALARQVISRLKLYYRVVAIDFRRAANLGLDVPSFRMDFNKRRFEDLFRRYDFYGVIHLGRIGADISSRFFRYSANVLGTQRLFELSIRYGVRQMLVLSTYFVYGASPYNPALLDEDTPLKAANLSHDLVDSVELENTANIYLYKHPDLHVTILRPCNIVGPGIGNNMGQLFSSRYAPVLVGFSPMMQFIHVEDMAGAVVDAFRKNRPGIYNVAPDDWIPYQEAVYHAGCARVPIVSLPSMVPQVISRILGWRSMPSYLVEFFKYPVIIDGTKFRETFGFDPAHGLEDIFAYYRNLKKGWIRRKLGGSHEPHMRRAMDQSGWNNLAR
ncbi:MAG: SDR family oxidoreductase [Desulfatibacillaceae bacterium]